MKKVISILGPTSSGKTDIALDLAKSLSDQGQGPIHIVSADSRQVYRELPVITGADIPPGFEEKRDRDFSYPFFANSDETIFLHGISNISIQDEWSLSHFRNLCQEVAAQAVSPIILVGGTGLYHRWAFRNEEAIDVQPDEKFRAEAESMSVQDLQELLKRLNPERFSLMNRSDSHNPRRLIRAIEIARSNKSDQGSNQPDISQSMIALFVDEDQLFKKIKKRVELRLNTGATKEVEPFLHQKDPELLPAYSTLGVSETISFLNKEISKEECVDLWARRELSYAKRQLKWLISEKNVRWLTKNEATSSAILNP